MTEPDPLPLLHESLLAIVAVLNRPQNDNTILARAGVSLDTALFPLLVRVSALPDLTIGALADQVGRDYSTVSRQISRLNDLGFIQTRAAERDRRQRLLSVTPAGQRAVAKIDRARRLVMTEALEGWTTSEISELARLTARFAAAMRSES